MRSVAEIFAYDDWANRETLASLERSVSPPPPAARRMAHIVAAELLWLGRLTANPSKIPVWPEWGLSETSVNLAVLLPMWRDYLETHDEQSRRVPISYVNSQGQLWESTPEDVLLHVAFHGSYHRGQIASDLRAAGFHPAYTDYIHAVRSGFVP
jgi:uncharacterized damage-inducible protein DinB